MSKRRVNKPRKEAAMSDRANELAATHVRVLTNDAGTWGIDLWGTWFPCDGETQEDVVAIAGDIRRKLALTLRAYAEEARREQREACATIIDVARGKLKGRWSLDSSYLELAAAVICARGKEKT